MQVSSKVATPKNVGKSNETTPEQQAELEAEALYTHKLERKYSATIEETEETLLLPMLAKDNPKDLVFPCLVQPKLDGNRCLAFWDGDRIKLTSRGGKEWTVPNHINEQVAKVLPKDSMFDGELYIHNVPLQTINSYIKKERTETSLIEYHIYDMPIVNGKDNLPFEDRWKSLLKATEPRVAGFGIRVDLSIFAGINLKVVMTETCYSLEEVKVFETKCVEDGYEGAIARNKHGIYTFGYRSKDLIKFKTFQDAEFLVVGCVDGVGKMEECAVFKCQNDIPTNGEYLTFECTVATTMEERSRMYKERDKYIGKKLTVRFFNRTLDNKPFHPVGKIFRLEEDL